jgi:hypothetical protein
MLAVEEVGDAMLTWERLEVLVEGRVGSKRPGVCECFLEWPLTTGPVNGDVALDVADVSLTVVRRCGNC